ncbi:fasciclin domain-containing protein [Mycobacterium cookii]|uniref:Immunogenic protein MPT70 n=1 Tax=Mycobacterium cookii TaxID=1775 RepID=A0A7I7L1L8_9MYCO|nr:fasciclin domain-containing protein [Mycobacterium cookii]MCV7329735.1 fasciclin domain-containing protein [Mycobacterium cookii]BBX47876.1 immunogenic protein MPT70 [Mycobacterium cookii]
MNIYSKLIPATGLAATAVGLVIANSAPAGAAPNLIGAGCADYAAQHPSGPASVTGMSQVPVAVAASDNPELTTLTAALSGQLNPQVNLVDTLNGGQFTVFAPTDAAFKKLPADTINQLKTNPDMLKSILTYHVVPGQLSPNQVDGSHNSVEGAPVNVTGSGNGLKVNNAGLVCGGVPTANAQVYMIDTVLMPPSQ